MSLLETQENESPVFLISSQLKQFKKKKDPKTGVALVENVDEFYIYQEKPGGQQTGVKLTNDSVSYVTSGILDLSLIHI